MIEKFIKSLNEELKDNIKSGFFKEDYFSTCNYNRQSEVHSRVLAVIIKTCYGLNYNVEVERRFSVHFNHKNRQFIPDICLYNGNELNGIIEYESTNSSDARLYDQKRKTSDFRYLEKYASNENNTIPKNWIIITTLPKGPIKQKDWKSRDPEIKKKASTGFQKLIESPYRYYYTDYIRELEKILNNNKIDTNVFLLNIDTNKVELEFKRISTQSPQIPFLIRR